ncbi:hypothetical protein E2C01_027889 [Portunus trituberculatus]|uniref:Uncharacterized protein n=1 Tax=Portunus trituberculatus TaxID=210409 RepID=A0A5B7EMJ6_PORTR|nr:hypothetical protein [Portunus trituberculatus]
MRSAPPQAPLTGRCKTPEGFLLLGILRRDWRNRTRYRNETDQRSPTEKIG